MAWWWISDAILTGDRFSQKSRRHMHNPGDMCVYRIQFMALLSFQVIQRCAQKIQLTVAWWLLGAYVPVWKMCNNDHRYPMPDHWAPIIAEHRRLSIIDQPTHVGKLRVTTASDPFLFYLLLLYLCLLPYSSS